MARSTAVFIALSLLFSSMLTGASNATELVPGAAWRTLDPTGAGWSTERLKDAEAWARQIDLTAVMVVHHGAVLWERGDTSAKTPLASVRKGLLSPLIGIAVERGQINLDQSIGELGIDDNEPSLTAEEKTATVRQLLQARCGIYHPALFESPDMAAKRPARLSHKPGTFWYYNNWDFNALGTICEHATVHSIFDAFERDIAQPIGMQDYRHTDGRYITGPASVHPAYAFDMSARDLARFALLYLRRGSWEGRETYRHTGSTKARSLIRRRIMRQATDICGGSGSTMRWRRE
jgi:CubicO group peptidase (beta-lactamase class C family)